MKWLVLSIIFAQGIDPETLEKKSIEAREILKKESVTFRRAGKGKNSRIISRDIMLAVGSILSNEINTLRLTVEVPKSARDRNFKFKVVTSGYSVERISGAGITRLIFRVVSKNTNEVLMVLDSHHLHLEKQRTSPRDLFYFPYSDLFQDQYFTAKGFERYSNIIRESQDELCATNIKSRAYPEKLLCEVFPDHFLKTLGAIEQMDDGEFFVNPDYSLKKFLAHIARNGAQAFSYSTSVDGARGLMQFMNSRRIRTYDLVKKKYPEANLIYDFEKSAADMKNSIKSAICLADMNLASLPRDARDKFEQDWFLGGIFVSAAHNGGINRALRLWNEFERGGIDFSNFRPRKRVLLKETENFIKKYLVVWKILERR